MKTPNPKPILLVALGGNALIRKGQKGTIEEQFENLKVPIRQIARNAGQEGSVVVDAVRRLPAGQGYDALGDRYGDMLELGIVDPVKVTRSALQNAVSIASMMLTTDALVTDLPEKKAPVPTGGPDYDDY